MGIIDAQVNLRVYTSGVSSPEGSLFLATYAYPGSPLWIHQYNGSGELTQRFKLVSEVELYPIFDIDFADQRIFVVTEDAEILAYSF